MDPAAERTILNADIRPHRENAAASDADGRGVIHGRGYKAAPGFRQDVPVVIPGCAAWRRPGIHTPGRGYGFRARFAPRNDGHVCVAWVPALRSSARCAAPRPGH